MARDPRLGIRGSLIAPGVVPQVAQEEQALATKIMAFVGGAAAVAGGAAQFAAIEKESRAMRDTDKFLDAQARGAGIPEQFETVEVHNAVWRNKANRVLDTIDPRTVERTIDEDDTAVIHRLIGEHTPGTPKIFRAVFREGLRQKFGQQIICDARLALRVGLSDTAADLRRQAYTGDIEGTKEAQIAHNLLADRAFYSEDQKNQPIVDGLTRAANDGFEKRVTDLAPQFLKPDDSTRLIAVARSRRQSKTSRLCLKLSGITGNTQSLDQLRQANSHIYRG